MNCRYALNLLSPHLEGELSEPVSTQVQAHLNTCPACAAEWTALQRVTLLLKADACAPPPPMPDLYAAFQQRLVKTPEKRSVIGSRASRVSWRWLMPRLVVCAAGVAIAGRVAWLRAFPYMERQKLLLATITNLEQTGEAPCIINSVKPSYDPTQHGSLIYSTTLWEEGYAYIHTSWQKSTSNAKPGKAPSKDTGEAFALSMPGGISLQWAPPVDKNKFVRIEWIPRDPFRPENNEAGNLAASAAQILRGVLQSGQSRQLEVSRATERVGTETMQRMRFGKLDQALRHSESQSVNESFPVSFTLWFDTGNKLRRVAKEYQRGDGSHWESNSDIMYPAPHSTVLTGPYPPLNRPVILGYRTPSKTEPMPERLVKPAWLTMTPQEKEDVNRAVWEFAEAWRTHEEARLRKVVDVDWPLETTRPDKRGGLNREDVWRKVWQERLHEQPQWEYFALTADFAFETAPRLLDEVPLNVEGWQTTRTLPGLNVLGWINASRVNGRAYTVGARLYLVKRPSGWKVVQFGQQVSATSRVF